MFNLGLSEIILISIIALIFIGPKQLPEIARALGRTLNELKRATEDLTDSFTNPKNYSSSNEKPTQQLQKPLVPPLEPQMTKETDPALGKTGDNNGKPS